MSDLWGSRAEAYRTSTTHMEGDDLEAVVTMCEPEEGTKALDVATGGGHVARRLREEGCQVVTVDSSPGMQPDVISRAEELPFADGSFDVVVCRIAAHHFADLAGAIAEMARVTSSLVVIEDTLYISQQQEEAERLRDPSHVRSRSEDEWKELFTGAGLEVERGRVLREGAPARRLARSHRLRRRRGGARDGAPRPAARSGRKGLARHEDPDQGPEVARADGDRRRQRHAPRRPGPDRQRGPFPRPAQPQLRHERRRRRHARQGRPGRRGHPGLQHGRRRRREAQARTRRSSSSRRGSRSTPSTRRSTPASAPSSASRSTSRRTTCCASTRTCAASA